MSPADDAFLAQLRATFRLEAQDHLQAIRTGLLALEKTSTHSIQAPIVETTFRAAHSLKGAARSVDLREVESICQSMEDVLAAWKRKDSPPSPESLDALHRKLDAIASALAGAHSPASPQEPVMAAVPMVDTAAAMEAAPAVEAAPPPDTATPETVRIAVATLDARLTQAQEMLTVKLSAGRRVDELKPLADHLQSWRGRWAAVQPHWRALRAQIDKAPVRPAHQGDGAGLAKLLEFMEWSGDQHKLLEGTLSGLAHSARQDRQVVNNLVDELLEDSRKLLLLPFSTIAGSFPKLVRDLCHEQGKQGDLKIHRGNTEVDKHVLEELKDPLIHLLRNCVDHGIELPAEREQRGKPPRATIKLSVGIGGGKLRLTVSDDGAGIDTARLAQSAVKQGLLDAQEAARLDAAQLQALVFRSAVSTSPIITQLSGRGLGLAIVREKVQQLGGSVSVESTLGVGTVFRIELPASRARFRGILVEVGASQLVLPTVQVERVMRARPGDIGTVKGRETLSLDGRAVSLVWLAEVMEMQDARRPPIAESGVPVVVLGRGDQRVAFAVDAVLDEQEILVKPLGKPLLRVRNIVAAAVLGSGRVALILEVADLLKSARKLADAPVRAVAQQVTAAPAQARTILVAEDSITSRMLLKGILESAGYRVKIAVDGIEAFGLLRTEPFDLVVSDVEMPRLNGFELTHRIRADKKLAQLPVVLVTALESRQDRESGIDAGANAYLVKSSFDQSNLLEAVQRLI